MTGVVCCIDANSSIMHTQDESMLQGYPEACYTDAWGAPSLIGQVGGRVKEVEVEGAGVEGAVGGSQG